MLKVGDKVSGLTLHGTRLTGRVVMAYMGQYQIVWDSGGSGSFSDSQLQDNRIKRI